ncbi:MAG TPA: MBL fold metallo-hydrolase [Polyangiaceae bacterium]|nr:MBL fold metallo-hydrolase [Polyangiaceae bacterium]
MRLTFLGAAQEVTGSLLLIEVSSGSLVIDCGMFQGRRQEATQRNRELPREALAADLVILTHAHLDHAGSLPTLVKSGFTGSIYSTSATYDLCSYMLRDSARIQASDAAYLNRKFADDPDWVAIEPLYGEQDVLTALQRFVALPYRRVFQPLPGVQATLINSGHILGSAQVILDVQEGAHTRRLVVSGDLGRKGLPIIRDPETPPRPVDYLVMESTYGNREHGSAEQMHTDLERVIRETVARRGKVIVPAFAVGRTQELLFVLHELIAAGRIPHIPIFIDSPLAIDVTQVFRSHPECFDAETRALLEARGDVFNFEGVRFMQSREESMQINQYAGPAVIISASGMAEAGRILHHLRNHVEDERNTILIVGFMAQHTLGRRLVEGRQRVKIWGVERELRAHVEVLNAFSAHADRRDLLAYVEACTGLRRAFLVHGEPEQQGPLQAALNARGIDVAIPHRGQTVTLD